MLWEVCESDDFCPFMGNLSHKFSNYKGKKSWNIILHGKGGYIHSEGFFKLLHRCHIFKHPPMCDNFLPFMGLHPIIPYLLWVCHNCLITCKFMGNLWDTCPYNEKGPMNGRGVSTWYTGIKDYIIIVPPPVDSVRVAPAWSLTSVISYQLVVQSSLCYLWHGTETLGFPYLSTRQFLPHWTQHFVFDE